MVECLRCVLVMCAIGLSAAAAPGQLQSKLFSYVDNVISKTDRLELVDGVTLVKTSEGSPRLLSGDFGMLLLDRLNSFVNTHAVRIDLSEPEFEGRGKMKKKKGGKMSKNYLLPLLLAIKAKMALLSALTGNFIAMIAAKAILVSKIALILGSMLFLKKLVTNPPKDVEHEHIKHRKIVLPVEEEEVHHEKEHWDKEKRYSDDAASNTYAQEMAYKKQIPHY